MKSGGYSAKLRANTVCPMYHRTSYKTFFIISLTFILSALCFFTLAAYQFNKIFLSLAKAQSFQEISLGEYYINQENVKAVQLHGNLEAKEAPFTDKLIRVILQDSIGGKVTRTAQIDSGGKFAITLDASSLLDGKIILKAQVLSRSELAVSRGEIKRGEQIFDELILIKDTLPPTGLFLNSVQTPTRYEWQIILGRKAANTSVWLNEREIIPRDESTVWSYNLKLKEGDNRISLIAKDEYGNQSSPVTSVITYNPLSPKVDLEFKEEETTGRVKIRANFTQEPTGTPLIAINTDLGADLPPATMAGSGTAWEYEYQGRKSYGKARVTILEENQALGTVEVIPLENATFEVKSEGESLKPSVPSWELPPPPRSIIEEPFPPPITSTTIKELDEASPRILAIEILDAVPVYRNGATIHLGIEYEDVSYEVAKSLIGPNYNPDKEYSYTEKDFSKEFPSWRPVRVDFSNLDSQAQEKPVRVGPLIKTSSNRFRRVVAYRISPLNDRKDAENLKIEIRVINLLNKEERKSVFVRLFNASPISVKKDILEKLEEVPEKLPEEIIFSGKGRPDSTIILYIYSDPIVVTVKTDTEGNWSYTLKRPLASGDHTVYAAEVLEEGKVGEMVQVASFIVPALAAEEQPQIGKEKLGFPEIKVPVAKRKEKRFIFEYALIAALLISGIGFLILGIAPDILERLRQRSKRRY